MVGEIRDHETAAMAIQSALTGHLVLSTLHTNDAASAVTRLLDLGIESYLVASSVVGVLAQRLVRRVCRQCGEPVHSPEEQIKRLGVDLSERDLSLLRMGVGCEACRQTGYSGRVGIFELLVFNDELRELVVQRASANILQQAAQRGGLRPLREDGWDKVRAGLTTIEEVLRATKA